MKLEFYPKYRMICAALVLLWTVTACAPPTEAVKPVALQNQKNLAALSENVQVLLALYEPLLKASSSALIYQHIGKTQQELIAVVGPGALGGPVPGTTWDQLFEKSASSFMGKKEKYHESYNFVKSALARGVMGPEMEQLRQREGWIFTAAAYPDAFTPQEAHALIKVLTDLKKTNPNPENFFQAAETRLLPYDGTLVRYRQATDGAQQLLNALKQEINNELSTAFLHSEALANYSESRVNMSQTLSSIGTEQLGPVIQSLGDKYIPDPNKRQAAIEMLSTGVNTFLPR